MEPSILMLIALIGAHCFFDYAGQGDFMAKAKNPTAQIPGVPWRWVMDAHASIHGAAVAIITGLWWLAPAEYAAHWLTDAAKCHGKITFAQDQWIHIACKLAWTLAALAAHRAGEV